MLPNVLLWKNKLKGWKVESIFGEQPDVTAISVIGHVYGVGLLPFVRTSTCPWTCVCKCVLEHVCMCVYVHVYVVLHQEISEITQCMLNLCCYQGWYSSWSTMSNELCAGKPWRCWGPHSFVYPIPMPFSGTFPMTEAMRYHMHCFLE